MNATATAVRAPAPPLAACGLAAAALAGAGSAWAFDDYYVRQWETADKEIIKLDKDITDLKADIAEMNAKMDGPFTKQEQDIARQRAGLAQDRIDLKEDRIGFLESEIERLENLSIASYKLDPDTEASLNKYVAALEEAYGPDRNFTVTIDRRDREIVAVVPPNSTLTADELEAAIGYGATVRVEEEESLVLARCPSPTSRCSPLEGGAEMGTPASNGRIDTGTLGYRAVDGSGNVGFVTAGHGINTGMLVKQPANGRTIGTVTQQCFEGTSSQDEEDGRVCDAAFIDLLPNERSSVKVISDNRRPYSIVGKVAGASQADGTFLKISGAVTGIMYGSLDERSQGNLRVIDVSSTSSPVKGDSGAPVFKQSSARSGSIYLYGVFTAFDRHGDAYYHTQDNIARRLGLR